MLWLLVPSQGEPLSNISSRGSSGSLGHMRGLTQSPHPQEAPALDGPYTAPPATHHPLHLLGHLVATQVVVEGALGPPVRRVVPDGVGSLTVHLGNHGLLFFLGKQQKGISPWTGPFG